MASKIVVHHPLTGIPDLTTLMNSLFSQTPAWFTCQESGRFALRITDVMLEDGSHLNFIFQGIDRYGRVCHGFLSLRTQNGWYDTGERPEEGTSVRIWPDQQNVFDGPGAEQLRSCLTTKGVTATFRSPELPPNAEFWIQRVQRCEDGSFNLRFVLSNGSGDYVIKQYSSQTRRGKLLR